MTEQAEPVAGVFLARAATAVVLLWHGRGANEAHVVRGLATALRNDGCTVITPDWDSTAADRGAGVLRESLDHAAAIAAEHSVPLVLAGWSLGGTAALSLALDPARAHDVTAVVGLAAAPRDLSPLSGTVPQQDLRAGLRTPPLHLVHGTQDPVVPPADAEEFARACAALGVPCSLILVDTDHAGVVGAEYDPAAGICVPTDGPAATTGLRAAVAAVRAAIAA